MTDSNTDDVPDEYERNGHRETMDVTDWVAAYFREAEVETVDTSTAGDGPGSGSSIRIIDLGGADEQTGVWADRAKVPDWIDVDLDLPVSSIDVKHRYDGGAR